MSLLVDDAERAVAVLVRQAAGEFGHVLVGRCHWWKIEPVALHSQFAAGLLRALPVLLMGHLPLFPGSRHCFNEPALQLVSDGDDCTS